MAKYQSSLMKEHLKLTKAIVEYGLQPHQISDFALALASRIQQEIVGSLKWEFQTRLLSAAVKIGILSSKPQDFDTTLNCIFEMLLSEFNRQPVPEKYTLELMELVINNRGLFYESDGKDECRWALPT